MNRVTISPERGIKLSGGILTESSLVLKTGLSYLIKLKLIQHLLILRNHSYYRIRAFSRSKFNPLGIPIQIILKLKLRPLIKTLVIEKEVQRLNRELIGGTIVIILVLKIAIFRLLSILRKRV
jgi:hypothetical protein